MLYCTFSSGGYPLALLLLLLRRGCGAGWLRLNISDGLGDREISTYLIMLSGHVMAGSQSSGSDALMVSSMNRAHPSTNHS